MGTAPQPRAQLFGQGPDIGALGAFHPQPQRVGCEIQQFQDVDLNGARGPIYGNALPCQLVKGLAVALERRIHGRHLLLRTMGVLQHRRQRGAVEGWNGATLDDFARGIPGVGALAEPHRHRVALGAGEQRARHLGGFADADRQHAGCERIEAAGVAGLGTSQQVAYALQGRVGRQPRRLIEQQDPTRRQHLRGHQRARRPYP